RAGPRSGRRLGRRRGRDHVPRSARRPRRGGGDGTARARAGAGRAHVCAPGGAAAGADRAPRARGGGMNGPVERLAAARRKLPPVPYADLVAEEIDLGSPTFVSVDVEDYYHEVPGGEEVFLRDGLPSNLARNTDQLLDLFAEHDVNATFFVLSCAAPRLLSQLDRMVDEGHEIASHGHAHGRATWMKPHEFRDDIRRAKATLEDLTGQEVRGYRAPYFAVTEESLWILDEIRDAGFDYDSSVCPVKNFAYGVPNAPERPHWLTNGLVEIPLPPA